MADEQETWLESLKNPLIRLGLNVVQGTLAPQRAFAAAKAGDVLDGLDGLTDERLEAVLEEADRFWRMEARNQSSNPVNFVVYPSLMVACAEARLEAIGRLLDAAVGEDRAALDRRLSDWLAVMARCLLAQGQALLLVPDPSQAGRSFSAAYHRAGQHPDGGSLHLYELLGACRGMSITAGLIGRTDMALNAERDLARFARTPGREFEALDHLVALDRDFIAILASILHRQGQKPAPPSEPSLKQQYSKHIVHYAEQVTSGRLTAEAAAKALRWDAAGIGVDSRTVYYTSLYVRSILAGAAPERATVLAELNYAVACDLTDPLAQLTCGYCAFALGRSLENRATRWRREHPDELGPASPYVNDLRRAVSHLEEALHLLSEQDVGGTDQTAIAIDSTEAVDIAETARWLLRCHSLLGNTARALEVGREAADRFVALEESPAKRSSLGAVLGNMGEVLEAVGELDASCEHYYRAFEHFLEAQNTRGILAALSNFSRLAARLGRLDDALAAADRAQSLMADVADVESLFKVYLNMVHYQSRIPNFEGMLEISLHAEQLSRALCGDEPHAVALRFHFLVNLAHVWTVIVQALLASTLLPWVPAGDVSQFPGAAASYKSDVLQILEKARQLALDLHDDDRLAQVYLQRAQLHLCSEELGTADLDCQSIDLISCSERSRAERDLIQGTVWFRQGRHCDAARLLRKAADSIDARDERKRIALSTLGQVLEEAGDLPSAVGAYEEAVEVFEQSRLNLLEASRIQAMAPISTIYERLVTLYADSKGAMHDSRKALLWLEKGKARTFTEALSLSPIPLAHVSESIRKDLAEEMRLLAALRSHRDALFVAFHGSEDRLRTQREIENLSTALGHLWDRLAPHLPEYVELRRASAITWETLKATVRDVTGRNESDNCRGS